MPPVSLPMRLLVTGPCLLLLRVCPETPDGVRHPQLPTPQGQDRSTQALEGEEPLAPEPWGLRAAVPAAWQRHSQAQGLGGAVPTPGVLAEKSGIWVGREGRWGGRECSLSPALEGMSEMPGTGWGALSWGTDGKPRQSPKQRPAVSPGSPGCRLRPKCPTPSPWDGRVVGPPPLLPSVCPVQGEETMGWTRTFHFYVTVEQLFLELAMHWDKRA